MNVLNTTALLNAIATYDDNYIKNIYIYRREEYLEFCKNLSVTHAFCKAQINCNGLYNDTIINFWRTIMHINHIETDNNMDGNFIDLKNLPKYITETINSTDHNHKDCLENYTSLWLTKHAKCVFFILTTSLALVSLSSYKLGEYFHVKEMAQNFISYVCNKYTSIISDPEKIMAVYYAAFLLTGVCTACYLVTQDYTKEYTINFFDWSKYKYRMLVSKKNIDNEEELDSVSLCAE